MNILRVGSICGLVLVCCTAVASAMSVDEALGRLKAYKFGQEDEVIDTIREAAVASFSDPMTRQKLLAGLTTVLESNAPDDAKRFACRQLASIGTEQQVPALARLLADADLSQIARYALARIPGDAVDRVLIDVLGRTDGANKLGIINTLGNRRAVAGVAPLTALLRSDQKEVAAEAAKALGRIGTPATAKVLEQALATGGVDREIAADAYLECADLLLTAGDRQTAGTMYERILASDLPGYIQGAALQGYACAMSVDEVLTEVVSALKRGDVQLQAVAARIARDIQGPEAGRRFAEAMPDLSVRAQAWLIRAMAGRREQAVAVAIEKACGSENDSVRLAALETLGTVGNAASIPVLLKAATTDSTVESAVACEALTSLPGEDVNKTLIGRLSKADLQESRVIVGALIRRDAAEAAPDLLKTARNRELQDVSFAGLQSLAQVEDVPAIIDLLAKSGNYGRVRTLLVALAQRCDAKKKVSEILTANLDAGKDEAFRGAVLVTLGELGDDSSGLPALRKALDDNQDAIRRAAIGGLGRWPNAAPLPDLLRVAREDASGTQVRALRAYIGLAGTAGSMQPNERIQCYKTALGMTPDATSKKMVFAGLQRVRTLESMQLAASHIQDADAKEEAALAAVSIAEEIYAGDTKAVAAILEQIASANVAAGTKDRAKGTLNEIKGIQNYVTAWEVAGPYAEKGKNYSQLFDMAFGPELPNGQVEWRKMPISKYEQHPAYADLLEELDGGEQKVAYLRAQIESPDAKPVTLEIFSDDGVKAWLNGKVVHSNNTARPIPAEPDRVNVTLDKGANTLMLKVTQNNMPWGAIVRIRDVKPVEPKLGEGWLLHTINADSRFEAAGVLDVNRDGKLDILSGGFWYEAPDWKRHFVREIKEEGDYYYYDFANLPMDVDGDGWVDTAGAAWHNKMVYWVRNPGKTDEPWPVYEIDTPGNMETAMSYDINSDGQPDVLPNIMSAAAWYEFHRDASAPQGVRWEKHPLPQEAAGHGLGAGDVNKDGRCDIVTPKGWLEQTADGWQWRPEFDLGYACIPILVHDAEGDGDSDIIWGLGHNYGLFWLEQKSADGKRTWEKHLIDDSWSQPHFMLMADLDNDAKDELVTGKRYYAHNGNDPGENDPRCVYWYKFDAGAKKWARHVLQEGGTVGLGINTMTVDIDADGDLDVVAPGKSGLYLFENQLK